jgi:ribosomal protein S27E
MSLLHNETVTVLSKLSSACYENAVEHGFYDKINCPADCENGTIIGSKDQGGGRCLTCNGNGYLLFCNIGERIALIHSEASEWLEAARVDGDTPMSEKIEGFTLEEEEAADIVIRTCDTAKGRGLRLAEAIVAKYYYNLGRPHKHNKRF